MIKLEHLNKTFGNHQALTDINTEFKEHQTTVIVGPSGSGKSTLLRSLNLLERPEQGLYHFNDETIDFTKPLTNKTILNIRRKTGMVFQGYNLFPHLSVVKNVMEGPVQVLKKDSATAKKSALELLARVGLQDKADAYPEQLSGGQQQRIGVVRALAADQDLVLMDEPFGALDPITRESLQDLVKDLQERLGKTFVFVTHDMDEALKLATRIVIMDGGDIMQVDTPDGILRHPANEFVENLIGKDRLIQARPSITTVGQVMLKDPIATTPGKSLTVALRQMHDKRVDSLLVTDEAGILKGVIGIEDVDYNFNSATSVGDIMKTDLFYVQSNSLIRDTVERILKRGLKNIPVVDEQHRLVGIVTRATLVDIVYDALWGDEDEDEAENNIHHGEDDAPAEGGEQA